MILSVCKQRWGGTQQGADVYSALLSLPPVAVRKGRIALLTAECTSVPSSSSTAARDK